MSVAPWATLLAFGLLGSPPAGYLSSQDGPMPYVPREGDLVFFDDRHPVWTALFALAGTGSPLHMGIVVKKPDGTLAVLEAGPDDGLWVELRDLAPRLAQFDADTRGTITIRRSKQSLPYDRSAALTVFAQRQVGKRYAVGWLLLQATPLRVRGPLEPWLAGTRLDQSSWICSEISIAAGTVAGLVNPKVVAANVAYPRDLVDDSRYDLRAAWHDPERWSPHRGATAARPGANEARRP